MVWLVLLPNLSLGSFPSTAFVLESTDFADARLLSCSLPKEGRECVRVRVCVRVCACTHVHTQGECVPVCSGCFFLSCLLQSKPRGPICWVRKVSRERLVGTKVRAWMITAP